MSKYDTEHPKKEVPAEVVDDVDNDMWYDLSLISKKYYYFLLYQLNIDKYYP